MANYKEKINPRTWEFNLIWKAEWNAWDYVVLDENWKVPTTQVPAIIEWRFISLWDCETWEPMMFSQEIPYTYLPWDFYIVDNISADTNYRPSWDVYDWTPSTDVETDMVSIWSAYIYDWVNWILQTNHWLGVSFASLEWSPYDNYSLWEELNNKISYDNEWTTTHIENIRVWTTAQKTALSTLDNNTLYLTIED